MSITSRYLFNTEDMAVTGSWASSVHKSYNENGARYRDYKKLIYQKPCTIVASNEDEVRQIVTKMLLTKHHEEVYQNIWRQNTIQEYVNACEILNLELAGLLSFPDWW